MVDLTVVAHATYDKVGVAYQLLSTWWLVSDCTSHHLGVDGMHILTVKLCFSQCMSEGTMKLNEKLKKEERGSSQALVLMAGTNTVSCFGAFGALATFNSSVGYRLIQLNPRRERDLVISKRYSLLGGPGELEGSIYFFIEEKIKQCIVYFILDYLKKS